MGHVIAFVPASGGVGASTLAAAVAVRAAAAARRTVAVDLDHLSGRLDVLFGVEQQPGWRWSDLDGVDGAVDGSALGLRLPVAHAVRVLAYERCGTERAISSGTAGTVGRSGEAVDEVVGEVIAGLARNHDVTVLDLPRDLAAVQSVAGLIDVMVLVAGSHLPQIAAAAATLSALRTVFTPGSGLGMRTEPVVSSGPPSARPTGGDQVTPLREDAAVRALTPAGPVTSWSSPPAPMWLVLRGVAVPDDLAEVVVDYLDVPHVGTVPDDRRVPAEVERGAVPGARGRGTLVEVADDLLLHLVSLEVAA